MNKKIYALLQLCLGIFILIGISELGNVLAGSYSATCKSITKEAAVYYTSVLDSIEHNLS